jgi:hypothetical protein
MREMTFRDAPADAMAAELRLDPPRSEHLSLADQRVVRIPVTDDRRVLAAEGAVDSDSGTFRLGD